MFYCADSKKPVDTWFINKQNSNKITLTSRTFNSIHCTEIPTQAKCSLIA